MKESLDKENNKTVKISNFAGIPGGYIPAAILKLTPDQIEWIKKEENFPLYVQWEINFLKNGKDGQTGFEYFLDNYASFIPLEGGQSRQPLKLWEAQKNKIVPAIESDANIIFLKTRRIGFTLLALWYIVWIALFAESGKNAQIGTISKSRDHAKRLLGQVKEMIQTIPDYLRDSVESVGIEEKEEKEGIDNAFELEIKRRGVKITGYAPNGSAEGEGFTLLLVDEFGQYDPAGSADPAKVLSVIIPALVGGGRVIIGSRSGGRFGKGKQFYQLYQNAIDFDFEDSEKNTELIEDKNGLRRIFSPWTDRPDLTRPWYNEQLAMLGKFEMWKNYPETAEQAFAVAVENLAFNPNHTDAVFKYGAELDTMLASGKLPPPLNGQVQIGIDWGIETRCVVIYPLPQHHFYIIDQYVAKRVSGEEASLEMIELAEEYGILSAARYDAAGAQQMRSFANVKQDSVLITSVPFNKFKQVSFEHILLLMERTSRGEEVGNIAISERCINLKEEMGYLEVNQDNKIRKGRDAVSSSQEDHTVDATIASMAPAAIEWKREFSASS